MSIRRWNTDRIGIDLPTTIQATGFLLLSAYLASFLVADTLGWGSPDLVDLAVGLATMAPFVAVIVLGGRWIRGDGLSDSRHPRIAKWFAGGLVGFLGVNLVMMAAWSQDSTLEHLGWMLYAAGVGGAGGLGVGIFEARAIERAVTAERQRVRRREAERRSDRLREFADHVAHDLRNPLHVAVGNLELAREERDCDRIEAAAEALERMDAIVAQTLQLAREGSVIGETERLDPVGVAERSWETVDTADASLVVERSGTIEADPDRLTALFENLFRNAVEHGGPGVTVRVGTTDEGFYVADDGPGISESDRERVLEPGYSTRGDGTGIGLAIVRQIADAHGWDLAVTESEDGGARFEVETGSTMGEPSPSATGRSAPEPRSSGAGDRGQ